MNYPTANQVLTPYTTLNWIETAQKYGVKIPQIIETHQGLSTCPKCSAVYAGKQDRCTQLVDFHRVPGNWHETRGGHPVFKTFQRPCNELTIWNLVEQFNIQANLFCLLEEIGSLPDPRDQPIMRFAHLFPPGVPEALNAQLIAHRVTQLEYKLPRIENAITQIIDAMSRAGNNLSFGGF